MYAEAVIDYIVYQKPSDESHVCWCLSSPLLTMANLAVGQNLKCESVEKQSPKALLFLSFKAWKTSSALEVFRLSNTHCLPHRVNYLEIQNIVLVPEHIKMAGVFVRGSDCNRSEGQNNLKQLVC